MASVAEIFDTPPEGASPVTLVAVALQPAVVIPFLPRRQRRLLEPLVQDLMEEVIDPMLRSDSYEAARTILMRERNITMVVRRTFTLLFLSELEKNEVLRQKSMEALNVAFHIRGTPKSPLSEQEEKSLDYILATVQRQFILLIDFLKGLTKEKATPYVYSIMNVEEIAFYFDTWLMCMFAALSRYPETPLPVWYPQIIAGLQYNLGKYYHFTNGIWNSLKNERKEKGLNEGEAQSVLAMFEVKNQEAIGDFIEKNMGVLNALKKAATTIQNHFTSRKPILSLTSPSEGSELVVEAFCGDSDNLTEATERFEHDWFSLEGDPAEQVWIVVRKHP